MWRGSEKETARVPPSLDSPLSAAPETFLLRDAVSAFPIAFGPQPQPLPGARCRVSVALALFLWRSFWNRALRLPDRASRLFPSPTSGQLLRDGRRVAAGAQRYVHVDSVRVYAQPFQHLVQHHRRVWRTQILTAPLPICAPTAPPKFVLYCCP